MVIKRIILYSGILLSGSPLCAQKNTGIHADDVSRVMNTLAADDMKGRKTYSPEIDKAAAFIAAEFKAAGLEPLSGNSYLQKFYMVHAEQQSLTAKANGTEIDPKNIVLVTAEPETSINGTADYTIEKIKEGENLYSKAMQALQNKKNTIVIIDKSFSDRFSRLASLKRNFFKTGANVLFILGDTDLKDFSLTAKHTVKENKLSNVAGLLPGKKLKNEFVIFSGHYDHLGIGTPDNGDSIYNGANDDASGTTAVIELAKYYKAKGNNERSIIFAAFTAEEVGGFGSQYFSKQLAPEKVVAMFNIEMIGTDSKWGKNSAYITGYEKTSMGDILQKNLKGSGFSFYPDPYPDQQLFYRSDNATLARLGVPAHTISTSKMDNEPNYHKASDEVKTLDLNNMTEIIKSIAISAQSIISGKDTPTRVNTEALK
ncbi:MAG: M20/M25/M40 family metallo-hydrolase [Niabella sp.]